MPTLGSTGKPSTTQEAWGLNANNQHSISLTLPGGGPWKITHVGVWVAGWNDSPSAKVCIWSTGGNLRRSSSSFVVANGGGLVLGTADEYYKALSSPYEVAGGTTIRAGISRDPAEGMQFPLRSGTHYDDYASGWPSDASWSSHSGELGVYITYEASNSPPDAPSGLSPTSGVTLTDLSPIFEFDGNDPDGDPLDHYDIQVDNNADFSSPLWDVSASSLNITGHHVSRTYGGSALSRGVLYHWRCRTADADGYGPWTERTFRINALPTASKVEPTSGKFATIHNLASDPNVWTSGGSWAKPRFKWSFSDADGDAQAAYRVKVYSASSGGSTLYDSGVVASAATQHLASWAGVRGTEYWWTIDVKDSHGEWAGESSRTAFKMQWGQAIYEYSVPGGASSSAWNFGAAAVSPGNGAFLFRTATGSGGTGASAWQTSIGALSPAAYLNVLVRLSPAVNTTSGNPLLPDMTFSYLSSALQPDRWVLGTVSGDWSLDSQVRRFGSQSLKLSRSATTGARYIYPFVATAGDDIPVTPNTEYTLSAYVNTNGVALGSAIGLYIFGAGADPSSASELSDLYLDTTERSTALAIGTDGWQRLRLRFRTNEQTKIRVVVMQPAAGSATSDRAWLDGLQLEESSIPTLWRPGAVSEAVTLDAVGATVDASLGGLLRLRGSAGGARDTVELGANGLVLGGDTEGWSSPASGFLYSPAVLRLLEQPGAVGLAPTNGAHLYLADNAGKTELRVRFQSGASITIAAEP